MAPLGVQDFVVSRLRQKYPFMKTGTREEIARKCEEHLNDLVTAQLPEMNASLDRTCFMSLPPELRDRIYELVLIQRKRAGGGTPYSRAIYIGRDLPEDYYQGERFVTIPRHTEWATQPALARVSRQVRQEALPMYYGANRFAIYREYHGHELPENPHASYSASFKWLKAIGPDSVKLLKDIRVRDPRPPVPGYEDPWPGWRFADSAKKNGIELPQDIVTGYILRKPITKAFRITAPLPRRWIRLHETNFDYASLVGEKHDVDTPGPAYAPKSQSDVEDQQTDTEDEDSSDDDVGDTPRSWWN